jgi:putative aldouronate transport system permease protein
MEAPRMKKKINAFNLINYVFLAITAIFSLLPIIHTIAVSFSENQSVIAGRVSLWPVNFTWEAYRFVGEKAEFWQALAVTVKRIILAIPIGMLLVILTAYPLSKEKNKFHGRTVYTWIFAITMYFGGGLVPTYMVISRLGLIDSIWVLVLPGAMNVWFVVLMLNFFRSVPKALEEAALIDGANQARILFKIYLPISIPSLATILLFTSINNWNDWFSGFIYMNRISNYPLQTYLAAIVMQASMDIRGDMTPEQIIRMQQVSEKTVRMTQIFLGALPIMLVYPFLQRYFMKGIVVGSVKG